MLTIPSQKIVSLLASRHSRDAFFTEVAIDGNKRRMDAWALIPSYSKSLTIAYEIKVSRHDFIQDAKMQEYIPYANEVYLVCPKGVAEANELPEGYGLIVASDNRLLTKKKAVFKETEIPESFYRALIASKVRHYEGSEIDQEFARRVAGFAVYEDYIAGKKNLNDIGHQVSEKLSRDLYDFEHRKKMLEMNEEDLKSTKQAWKVVCDRVKAELGVDINHLYDDEWGINKVYRDLMKILSHPEHNMFETIENLHSEMIKLREKL